MEQKNADLEVAAPCPGLGSDEGFQRSAEMTPENCCAERQEDAGEESKTAGLPLESASSSGATQAGIEIYRLPADSSDGGDPSPSSGAAGGQQPFLRCLGLGSGAVTPQRSRPPSPPVEELAACSLSEQDEVSQDQAAEGSTGSARRDGTEPTAASASIAFSSLLGKALRKPRSLNCSELDMLAQGIFNTGTMSVAHAASAAKLCLHVITRVADEAFVQGLLRACHGGIGERVQLAREASAEPRRLRWMPYITFLAELLVSLELIKGTEGAALGETAPRPTKQLAKLLCICCRTLLSPPWLMRDETIDCLRAAMTIAGRHMDEEDPEQMKAFLFSLRDCYVGQDLSASRRSSLLELIQCHAAGWRTSRLNTE